LSKSQNGWPAYSDGRHPDLVAIPHVAGRVRRGDVAAIFTHLIGRFDREVEAVAEATGQPEDDWGWASRPVRGKTTDLSNHASGTAIDLNAPRHPLGRSGTFSPAQVRALRPILAELAPVVRWGGDYPGRKDEMHFEIVGTPAQVEAVAARLLNAGGGASVAPPTTAPPTPAPREDPLMRIATRIGDEAAYLVGPTSMIQLNFDQAQAYIALGVPVARLNPGQVLSIMQATHYSAADEDNTQVAYRGDR